MRSQTSSLLAGVCSKAFRNSSNLTSKARLPVYKKTAITGFGSHHWNRTITTNDKSRSPVSAGLQSQHGNQEYIYESIYDEREIPNMPVSHLIFNETHKWVNKVAMECGLTGRHYTYGELRDMTWRFGGMLQNKYGKGSNPTIAILSPNTPEYATVYFGTMAAGGTITTINAAYTPVEVANHLADSGATMLVVESMFEPLADAALQILKKDIPIIVNGTSQKNRPNLLDIVKSPDTPFASDIEYDPDLVALLPYSSGTTGKPKGVRITHGAINAGLTNYHFPEGRNIDKAEGDHQEILMGLLPFFHIYGMSTFLSSGLSRGAKLVTLPRFDPKTYVSSLKQHKMTVLHTVPPLMQFTLVSPDIKPEDLKSVHSVLCGAAPVSPLAASALKQKAGDHLCFQEAFGMTETHCTHLTPRNGEKLGCCGKLIPQTLAKIIDIETGASLPPGGKGELLIKTPSLMAGYHNNPEATRETVDEEGWLHTGDVAICDDEGYFSIVDRIKELIKVKGLQVAPSELEDILLDHPDVADVGVIGVKEERSGEVPRAYIVPRNKSLSEDDIHAFIEPKVARHKKLVGGVRFVQELPKNATGKLLRRQLKIMAEEESLRG